KKRLGRPMTFDQRARLALGYTVAIVATFGLLFGWLAIPHLPKFDMTSPARVALAFVGFVVVIVVAAAARFGLLTAASKLVWRRPAPSRTHVIAQT
ncbi:MAG: hypothetical protein ABI551_10385, partial [Polyangiaceae bacterium]